MVFEFKRFTFKTDNYCQHIFCRHVLTIFSIALLQYDEVGPQRVV